MHDQPPEAPAGAVILRFPQPRTQTARMALPEALAHLQQALDEQASALAGWRQRLGELHGAMARLHGSLAATGATLRP